MPQRTYPAAALVAVVTKAGTGADISALRHLRSAKRLKAQDRGRRVSGRRDGEAFLGGGRFCYETRNGSSFILRSVVV